MFLESMGEAGSIEELLGGCVVLGSHAGDDLFKKDRKLIRIERSSLSYFSEALRRCIRGLTLSVSLPNRFRRQ